MKLIKSHNNIIKILSVVWRKNKKYFIKENFQLQININLMLLILI